MIKSRGLLNNKNNVLQFYELKNKNLYLSNSMNTVEMKNVEPVIKLLALLYALAITILLLEYFHYKFYKVLQLNNKQKDESSMQLDFNWIEKLKKIQE